jgi:hypothetical protein
MSTPTVLLKLVGKSLLSASGIGPNGELAIEVLPEVVKAVWEQWSRERDEAHRCTEIEALIAASVPALRQAVREIVNEIAANELQAIRDRLTAYLMQVPPTMRHSLRRPENPSGNTLPARLPVQKAEDLLMFLPARLPASRWAMFLSPASIGSWRSCWAWAGSAKFGRRATRTW